MTDVRLTALNPVDSQVYPVACNTSGELIVANGGPDLTVTGDLTVNGSSTLNAVTASGSATFNGGLTSGSATFDGSVNLELIRIVENGTTYPRIIGTPDGTFYSESSAGVYPWQLNPNGNLTLAGGITLVSISASGNITASGTASFAGGNTGVVSTEGNMQIYRSNPTAGATVCAWFSDVGGTKSSDITFFAGGTATFSGNVTAPNITSLNTLVEELQTKMSLILRQIDISAETP